MALLSVAFGAQAQEAHEKSMVTPRTTPFRFTVGSDKADRTFTFNCVPPKRPYTVTKCRMIPIELFEQGSTDPSEEQEREAVVAEGSSPSEFASRQQFFHSDPHPRQVWADRIQQGMTPRQLDATRAYLSASDAIENATTPSEEADGHRQLGAYYRRSCNLIVSEGVDLEFKRVESSGRWVAVKNDRRTVPPSISIDQLETDQFGVSWTYTSMLRLKEAKTLSHRTQAAPTVLGTYSTERGNAFACDVLHVR